MEWFSQRRGDPARRVDQRTAEQSISALRARPMVRAHGQTSLAGEAYLVRYIDDFVVCFQYRADALRLQDALRNRLGKFSLMLEPSKTKLVEFGRFAQHTRASQAEAPGNHLLPGLYALLHAQPEGQFQGWDAYREVTLAAQPSCACRR